MTKAYTYHSVRCRNCSSLLYVRDDEEFVLCQSCTIRVYKNERVASLPTQVVVPPIRIQPAIRTGFCPICSGTVSLTRNAWVWLGHCDACDRGIITMVSLADTES